MTWKVVETVVFFDGYSNKIYAFISMHFFHIREYWFCYYAPLIDWTQTSSLFVRLLLSDFISLVYRLTNHKHIGARAEDH
jgi:hypothetical protein